MVDIPTSRQSLHEKATICGWVSFIWFSFNYFSNLFQLIIAVEQFASSAIVSRCSASTRKKVNDIIKNINKFFLNVLGGSSGRSKEEQCIWRDALTSALLQPYQASVFHMA